MFSRLITAKCWEHFGGGLRYLLDGRGTMICHAFYQEYLKNPRKNRWSRSTLNQLVVGSIPKLNTFRWRRFGVRRAKIGCGCGGRKLKVRMGPILGMTPIARPEMIKVILLTTIPMNSFGGVWSTGVYIVRSRQV